MSKVAVVGAGASGIIAALRASERHSVILLDANDKCGKKLLLTGNGRCNYWNSSISADMYETDDKKSLEKILSNAEDVLSFLENLGIYPRIKNGYYYPYSNQAASIREIFEKSIDDRGIKFKTGFKTESITEKGGKLIIVSSTGERIECDKVIIASGSKSYPKTGSDGSGYNLAKALGHSINPVLPSLTELISTGSFLKDWEKIRCDARVSLLVNGRCVKSDVGEIQLTRSGISGICTFNISSVAAKNLYLKNDVEVCINFMPYIDCGFYKWFGDRCEKLGNVTLERALESIFNYKLMFVLLKRAKVSKDQCWTNLSENEKLSLCKTVEEFRLSIIDTETFDKAQVCTGGVPLSQINPDTMESTVNKNVYFAGEILDVDGRCGGYNLSFAFISGYIAGGSV